jgi:hypothetical protein
MKGLPYEVKSLVQKACESAQLAVETYNWPTAQFRSGAYVVLMITKLELPIRVVLEEVVKSGK